MLFQSFPSAAPSFPFRTHNNGDPIYTSKYGAIYGPLFRVSRIIELTHQIAMPKVELAQVDKRLVLIIT